MALFTTRGCSFVPDGKAKGACDEHDIGYAEIKEIRKSIDDEFLFDMLGDGVWKIKAYIYYYAVRAFGRICV